MSDDQSECEEKVTKPIYTEQTVIFNKYEGFVDLIEFYFKFLIKLIFGFL